LCIHHEDIVSSNQKGWLVTEGTGGSDKRHGEQATS
jgi:streptomycin 6-kinase